VLEEKIDTLVIGAGQAGIAMSEHLSNQGIEHLVLERHRVAERWRSERWDSLVANGPAWHDRFPTLTFDSDANGFPDKNEITAYFERYAQHINAPIRCNVNVERVRRDLGHSKFEVTTSEGVIRATQATIKTQNNCPKGLLWSLVQVHQVPK